MKKLRQWSIAQRHVITQQEHEKWSYHRRLKRKQLFEKGTLAIEKSNYVLYLRVKGWCVAVASGPQKDLNRIIDAVCDTIDIMKYGCLR